MIVSDAVMIPKRPTTVEGLVEMVGNSYSNGSQVRVAGTNSFPATIFDAGRGVEDVSTLRMNRVIEHAVGDMTVIVQAGISLEALQRALAWHNQWLPIDPPIIASGAGTGRNTSPGQRTIGGLIASNALGPLRFGCGDWRMLIMGMKWVDGTGTLIKGGGRTVKNVAGYNTPRMMIGSCGSLGAIAEVTLRTYARPVDEKCVVFMCDGAERAESLVAEVMTSQTTPAYVEAIGGGTFATNPLQLPTMRNGVVIVVGFLDRATSCDRQIEIVRGLGAARNVDSISQTAAQAGRLRLWMTTEPAAEQEGIGFRISVLSSETCAVIPAIDRVGAEAGDVWVVGEAGTGVVRGMIRGGEGTALVRRVLAEVAPVGRLFFTQGRKAIAKGKQNELVMRIKAELDPRGVFGLPSVGAELGAERLAGNFD